MREQRTLTKADITNDVCERVAGFSKDEAATIVDSVFEMVKSTLESGKKLKISGFGTFAVRQKAERTGRDPRTGDRITIAA
jgi:integration host factor subunit alpha